MTTTRLLTTLLFVLPWFASTAHSGVPERVEFHRAGDVALAMNITTPPGHQSIDRRPAVVFFFGGGWAHGDPSQFAEHAKYFASRGMVAVCPEYRTREGHGTTPIECITDGKAAIRYLRSHAAELGIDPKRIAAGGGSAGGHVAASTAILNDIEAGDAAAGNANLATSCVPDALVLFNPVLDTTSTGYGAKKLGDKSLAASPVHHVRSGLPPTIIFHGRADTTVPHENAQRFHDAMIQSGNSCILNSFDDVGHGFYWKGTHRANTLAAADDFFVALGWLGAKPNGLELHDAFVSGTEGYHTYRIPSLVVSRKGTLLLFCDARVNGSGDKGKMDLVVRRSLDGGRTWQPNQVLFDDPQGEAKIGNVSAVVDRETGAIHAVFCKDLTTAYVRTSTDDGATFSPAVDITAAFKKFPYDWKWFATGHAHGIQLRSGRLLVPVFMSSVDRFGGELKAKSDFRVGTVFSDDHGKTWQAGGLVPNDQLINESTIFETSDGGVVVNSRSHRRSVRVQARSTDGAATWSDIAATPELRGPACQGSSIVATDPAGKRVTLFSHITEDGRANLVVHLSYDDGRTWPLFKVVDPGRAAYSELALADDGTIYLAYEKDASKRISVAKFDVAWLLDGPQKSEASSIAATPVEPRSREVPKLAGFVVDDEDAEFVGEWLQSKTAGPLFGGSYRHDDNKDQGKKSVRFKPCLPVGGEYEVRLIYRADKNRATNVKVTVAAARGEQSFTVNQRQNVLEGGVPRALGTFPIAAGEPVTVTVSNDGADGFVIVDAVQFVSVDEAKVERAKATEKSAATAAKKNWVL